MSTHESLICSCFRQHAAVQTGGVANGSYVLPTTLLETASNHFMYFQLEADIQRVHAPGIITSLGHITSPPLQSPESRNAGNVALLLLLLLWTLFLRNQIKPSELRKSLSAKQLNFCLSTTYCSSLQRANTAGLQAFKRRHFNI